MEGLLKRFTEHDSNRDFNMQRFHDKRKSTRKVENFGVNLVLASYDDKEALRSMYKQEFIFCEQVNERLRSSDDYQAFLKCLHIYSTEIITKKYLQSLMALLRGLVDNSYWCMEKNFHFCVELI
ncbi:unnamed protein product [Camellia sinensis]